MRLLKAQVGVPVSMMETKEILNGLCPAQVQEHPQYKVCMVNGNVVSYNMDED